MQYLEVLTAVFGVVGVGIGAIGWYTGAVRKAYAAEREFMHLKSIINQSYSDISKDVQELVYQQQRMADILLEIKLKCGVNSDS